MSQALPICCALRAEDWSAMIKSSRLGIFKVPQLMVILLQGCGTLAAPQSSVTSNYYLSDVRRSSLSLDGETLSGIARCIAHVFTACIWLNANGTSAGPYPGTFSFTVSLGIICTKPGRRGWFTITSGHYLMKGSLPHCGPTNTPYTAKFLKNSVQIGSASGHVTYNVPHFLPGPLNATFNP